MPYCWHFDTTNATFGATAKVNSGTGTAVAFLWGDEKENNPGVNTTGYITAPTANAALGTAYAMNAGTRATWRIYSGAGLGATVGSGFTFSLWMRGNAKPNQWSDCFTFGVGGRYIRYEFNDANPAGGDCCYEWLNGCGPTNVDVEVYAPAYFKLKGNADVKGLVYEGTLWQKNQVVSHLLVYGRYLAGPCHLPINMRNGSTLDLSAITGSFDLTNAVANTTAYVASAVVGDMTFQSGTAEAPSIINVNLAGKTDLNAIRKSVSPYVVTWPSQPANVDFVLDAQSHADGYRIYPEAGGLRLKRFMGVMILVR